MNRRLKQLLLLVLSGGFSIGVLLWSKELPAREWPNALNGTWNGGKPLHAARHHQCPRNVSHHYLVVSPHGKAALKQARDVWKALHAPAAKRHPPSSPSNIAFGQSAAPAFTDGLSLCPSQIEARMRSAVSLAPTVTGTQCVLHVIAVIPDPIDYVYARYYESVATSLGQTAGAVNAKHSNVVSLREWSNQALNAAPQFCFTNDTANPICCLDPVASGTDSLSPVLEAVFSSHLRRWRECARSAFRSHSLCSVTFGEVLPGTGHHHALSVDVLQSLCLSTDRSSVSGQQDLQDQLKHIDLQSPTTAPAISQAKQIWDLQTHSRLSRFFEKFNTTRASVRDILEEAKLDKSDWVRSLKLAAGNCSTAKRTVVVVFCEVAYSRILLNWMVYYTKLRRLHHRLPPALIVTPSVELHTFLRQYYPCSVFLSPVPSINMAAAFWKTRLRVFLWLSRWRFTVLHSDVDAIWLRNPVPTFIQHLRGTTGARFLFGQDIYPGDQLAKWGATACMGLVAYRGGHKTNNFWFRSMQKFVQLKDDQRSVNSVLDDGSLSFDKGELQRNPPKALAETDAAKWSCARTGIYNFTACLMPHAIALRHCSAVRTFDHVYVAHCHSTKNGLSKEASLRERSLWQMAASALPMDITLGTAKLSPAEAQVIFLTSTA